MAQDEEAPSSPLHIGSAYPAAQLARALVSADSNDDPQARERVRRWSDVLMGTLSGVVAHGQRQPVARFPEWVTLEVVTGGFATGQALSAGPLLAHELRLLDELGLQKDAQPRLLLNRYFLSDAGLLRLGEALREDRCEIAVPEEGALPMVAWLMAHGHVEPARELIDVLAPHMAQLRFYPTLSDTRRSTGTRVQLEDAATTARRLQAVRPNPRILAQREAVGVWTPLYDRLAALFLETVAGAPPCALKDDTGAWRRGTSGQFVIEGGWPCTRYPAGWTERAAALSQELHSTRETHRLCGRVARPRESLSTLIDALGRVLQDPAQLTRREQGLVRLVLARYVATRGLPGSDEATRQRDRQQHQATAPTHQEIAACVARRLAGLPQSEGVDDLGELSADIAPGEVAHGPLANGARIPPSIVGKLERCVRDTVDGLVQRGLLSSGEVLAQVLPQLTSGLRAAGMTDRPLRELYAAVYRAFRRRRSLLLLDLQKQVQFEELPWVRAMERHRGESLSTAEQANQALVEVCALTLKAFPQAIVPNKLLQEVVALARTAQLPLPITEELAADIFMGRFSPKFVDAVRDAADRLRGSLYARYYTIDYDGILQALAATGAASRGSTREPDGLSQVCARRAGVTLGTYRPAVNGQVIEQQLILTTHNLATIASLPGVQEALAGRWHELARRGFDWLVDQLQLPDAGHHVALHRLKNAAYAWRQMVFFLSMDESQVDRFLQWSSERLRDQPAEFQHRFEPAMAGLRQAAGRALQDDAQSAVQPMVFLGWTSQRHWLMPPRANAQPTGSLPV